MGIIIMNKTKVRKFFAEIVSFLFIIWLFLLGPMSLWGVLDDLTQKKDAIMK